LARYADFEEGIEHEMFHTDATSLASILEMLRTKYCSQANDFEDKNWIKGTLFTI